MQDTQINSDGIKRVLDWAHAPSPYLGPIGRVPEPVVPTETGMTNLQVLGLLVSINGFRPRISGWGVHQGPFGVTRSEALLMMEMSSYFQGLIDGAGLAGESATNLLNPELAVWAAKWEALGPPDAVEAVAAEPVDGAVEVAAE